MTQPPKSKKPSLMSEKKSPIFCVSCPGVWADGKVGAIDMHESKKAWTGNSHCSRRMRLCQPATIRSQPVAALQLMTSKFQYSRLVSLAIDLDTRE